MRRPEIPEMRVPGQLSAWSSKYPGADALVRWGFDQPRGTSTSVVPRTPPVSARKPKVKSLVLPAGTRFGVTVIFPIPTRVAAPPAAASTSAPNPAHSAASLTPVTNRPAIDPVRVYLDCCTDEAARPALGRRARPGRAPGRRAAAARRRGGT